MKSVLVALLTLLSLNGATIAHYKFIPTGSDEPLYELTDSSGNGHHGRVIGREPFELIPDSPSYPGVAGASLDARGRNDYAVIPHHADFAPEGDWMIEFFVKPALFHQEHGGETNIAGPFWSHVNTNLSYTILAKQNTNQPTKYGCAWAFHYQPATGWVIFTISRGADPGETLVASKDLRDGKWHHIAVVFAASQEYEIRLFEDGFQSTSSNIGNIPFSWGSEPIYVGAFARQNESYSVRDRNFDGFLDEIRFSDAALRAESFVVNFTPILFAPIQVDVHAATEIQFPTQAEKVYRVEQLASDSWATLGYRLGDGTAKSFFHRGEPLPASAYRVSLDTDGAPVQLSIFNAVEVRFPTDHGATYTIQRCKTVSCQESDLDQIFVLGDGGMWSHFERIDFDQSRFYTVRLY